jgi:hypothetical protein
MTQTKLLSIYGVVMTQLQAMQFQKYISNNHIAMNTKTSDERKATAQEWLDNYRLTEVVHFHIEYTNSHNLPVKETFLDLPAGTYFAYGYHNEEDAGKAYVMRLTNAGTSLIPVIFTATGLQFIDRSKAGQEV